MYSWIIERPNILAYLENISVALYMWRKSAQSIELSVKEISVTPRVANCHGYMNQHLVCSYICSCQTLIVKHRVKQSTNKNKTRKCFVQFTKSCCSVFFIASLMASFSIAVPLPQQLSIKLTISLLLKNTIDLLFVSEHKLYGFPQSAF